MENYSGNIVDPVNRRIYKGLVKVKNGVIQSIEELNTVEDRYILPGFIDSHIHIESSMLTPENFSRELVKFGTVATVSDPHEIANVLGVEGIDFMIQNAKNADIKIFFGIPSCVPATGFEKSGAFIDSAQVERLLQRKDLYYLSEMMNFPGVVYGDREVLKKLEWAKKYNKPIDGHAPGLSGEELEKYVGAGISTDHECFTMEEALEKIRLGMIIQIREGSAAKNFENLYPLIDLFPDQVMLCSDDLHPDDIVKGHMNLLFKRALENGLDFFNVLRSFTVNPVKHYGIPVGLLQEGDPADFILVNDLKRMDILETYVNGKKVFPDLKCKEDEKDGVYINSFYRNRISGRDIKVSAKSERIKCIGVLDGELITETRILKAKTEDGYIVSDIERDILKVVVQNRYAAEKPAIGFINGFTMKEGGLVSTIAHDSHNIIAVGTSDNIILDLVEWVNNVSGGIAVHDGKKIYGLELPVAGIISDRPASIVAEKYSELDKIARKLGCELRAPFMTLSFMSLLVIPELKIGNKGLFDVNQFDFTDLYVER